MELARHVIHGHKPGPHLLITGGVHGDEFEPMAAIRRMIREIRPEELCGRVTLVPVVNEPAFRRGQRTAEDGLDLARTCPGRVDGSVTERIAWELSKLIRSADYYIDLHTGGTRLTVLPLTGYTLHPNAEVLEKQRRMARAFGLPLIWGTDPNLEGRSLSVARDANVPAIYAEYLGGGRFDPQGVEAYVRGCLGVMAEMGMLPQARSASEGNARFGNPTSSLACASGLYGSGCYCPSLTYNTADSRLAPSLMHRSLPRSVHQFSRTFAPGSRDR